MTAIRFVPAVAIGLAMSCISIAAAVSDPFADAVVSYDPGPSPSTGYTTSTVALGSPERFTGEGIFPSVVSPFNSPFGTNELVSISPGGHLTLHFDEPITNDADNLYGIDLIIFGNAGFIDGDYPNAVVGGVFSNDGGMVEVSPDGVHWVMVRGASADDLMPACGFLDSGPYDIAPGAELADFTRPVDPLLSYGFFEGLSYGAVVELYRGSGGGSGVDIDSTGLESVSFVRISLPANAADNMEIDAVADVAPRRTGDVDLDGHVGVADLLGVIAAWGPRVPGGIPADFNNDGLINVNDLLMVIMNWGP